MLWVLMTGQFKGKLYKKKIGVQDLFLQIECQNISNFNLQKDNYVCHNWKGG